MASTATAEAPVSGTMQDTGYPDVRRNVLGAIGNTPLVKLSRLQPRNAATILAKLEFMNPGGAVKDRMAIYMIERAEQDGRLKPGGTIVENTSGNTGVGLAMAAAIKGYRCVFSIPDKMSAEKINTLKAFGADVYVCPTNVPAEHPDSYYETAKRLARDTPGAWYPNQYHNQDNIAAHYHSTGPEIWRQTGGKIDCFVAGLGTGGTMSGAGRYLKEQNPAILNVGADPIGSVYHSLFHTGKPSQPHVYKVEGIGEDMICGAMDMTVLDDVRQVDDRSSFLLARRACREEGLLCGGSSGSALQVAIEMAKELGPDKTVVTLLPDGGRAYITKYFSDEWMRDMGFLADTSGVGTVRDLLEVKTMTLVTATPEEKAEAVVARMKKYGISQMPIINQSGNAVGMIHESDLLSALLNGEQRMDGSIDPIVTDLHGLVDPNTPLSDLRQIFSHDHVAVVQQAGKVIGIVTQIDVIEFMGEMMKRK